MNQPRLFKWRHYEPQMILLYLRWYVRYSLSYRDLEEIMTERGLLVSHTTISAGSCTILLLLRRNAEPGSSPQTAPGVQPSAIIATILRNRHVGRAIVPSCHRSI